MVSNLEAPFRENLVVLNGGDGVERYFRVLWICSASDEASWQHELQHTEEVLDGEDVSLQPSHVGGRIFEPAVVAVDGSSEVPSHIVLTESRHV